MLVIRNNYASQLDLSELAILIVRTGNGSVVRVQEVAAAPSQFERRKR
jgi:hypothetical protein